MKAKMSKTDVGDVESGQNRDSSKSKIKKNAVKITKLNSSASHSSTSAQKITSTDADGVVKKKKKDSSKAADSNSETNFKKETFLEVSLSENKKKRKRDVSQSTTSAPAKKAKKESSKAKEKLKALSKKKWMKIKKKKKAKTLLDAEDEEDEKSSASAQVSSLEYLKQWKNDKSHWSFQKVRQVWLLKNMYNEQRVSEKDFVILLEYLEGLQGAARKMTVEKSEKIMKDADDTSDNDAEKSTFSEGQLQRVRQVLQLLY